MTYTLELVIPGLPKTTNSLNRAHWGKKVFEARTWRMRVQNAVLLKRGAPEKPLEKAKLTLTRYSSKRPDADGLVSSFKHVIDGLIDAKVIADDNFGVIGMPEYKWEEAKMKDGKIKIKVEEVT